MGRTLRFSVTFLALLCSVLAARQAQSAPALGRGTAITCPAALREREHGRFGLTRVMQPVRSSDAPLTNSQLFALPSMAPVRKALDDEFERYVGGHKSDQPGETMRVGGAS